MGFISLTDRNDCGVGLNTRVIREVLQAPSCTVLVVDDPHFDRGTKTVTVRDGYSDVMAKIFESEKKDG